MQITFLADYIREHKDGQSLHYAYNDISVILQHTRRVLCDHRHITDEHVFECCEKAETYEAFISLCQPLAVEDTEAWLQQQKLTTAERTNTTSV
jgi:hypothetical protein